MRVLVLAPLLLLAACGATPNSGGGNYDSGGPAPVFGTDSGGPSPPNDVGAVKPDTALDSLLSDAPALVDVTIVGDDGGDLDGNSADLADDGADAAEVDAAKVDAKADAKADAGDAKTDSTPNCGDKKCDVATEDCANCPSDCGKCPPLCGDGTCDSGETCADCPSDCCTPKCGNGTCESPSESCSNCNADCGNCPTGSCNTITSQGCKAAEQCYLGTDLKPVCGAPGSVAAGLACNAVADCVKGYICVSGQCSKVCDTKDLTPGYSCPGGGVCDELSANGVPLPNNLGVCFGGQSCNLADNSGCPAGQGCIFGANTKGCVISGQGGSGATCQGYGDCLATHICVNDGKTSACRQKCTTTGTLKCSSGQCMGLTTGNPPKTAPDSLGGCF